MIAKINIILEREYHQLFLWYFACFIFGAACFFVFRVSLSSCIFAAAFAGLLLPILYYFKGSILHTFSIGLIISFTVGLTTAQFRHFFAPQQLLTSNMTTELVGTITNIKPAASGAQIILENTQLLASDVTDTKIRLNLKPQFTKKIKVGQKIKLKAKLFKLGSSKLPGGFDFGLYLQMSGIVASGYAISTPVIIQDVSWQNLAEIIENCRCAIYKRLIDVIGSKGGNFAAAILIGETKGIDKETAQATRDTGIAHILSVSGLHLSLVAMICFFSARIILNFSDFISYHYDIKKIAAIISLMGSFLYLKLTGSNIAASRAFVMTALFIIAIIAGRSPSPLRSLMIAAFLILLSKPEYSMHPSFQLSFAAVMSLLAGYDIASRKNFLPRKGKGVFASLTFYLSNNIYSSFLASILSAPLVLYHFYKFPNYSVLMNLLAVPLMSFCLMPLGVLSLILMPLGLDFVPLKILGFFIMKLIGAAEYVASLAGALFYSGYVEMKALAVFTLGFFSLSLLQSKARYAGLIPIIASIIMIGTSTKPELIFNHHDGIIAYLDQNNKLVIYKMEGKLKDFDREYIANWYGFRSAIVREMNPSQGDLVLQVISGKTISMNYQTCHETADVEILASPKLKCGGKRVITYQQLKENGILSVY